MPNYNQSKIYKVICSETQKLYIGSTCQPLYKRLFQHKSSSNPCMSKTFINPTIVLIENLSCQNKEELTKRERYYIDSTDCVNKQKPGRTQKEHYQDNKDKILEQQKQYYQDNREKKIEKVKQHYQNNIDKIKEYKKQYRLDNKEKLKNKTYCECGGYYIYGGKNRHLKSKKHITHIHNQAGGN